MESELNVDEYFQGVIRDLEREWKDETDLTYVMKTK